MRENAKSSEIEKFGRLAAGWWDPHGPVHSLHAVNALRAGFITHEVEVRGMRIMDVGCGAGLLTEALARLGARVSGTDLSNKLLEMARLHAAEAGLLVDYSPLTAEDLAEQQPGSFDIVTCMEVLEHVPQPSQVVSACARLLRPGGHAFFSTIDRTARSLLFAIIGAEYVLRLLPVGSHNYHSLIRPAELKAWAAAAGFSIVRQAGISYHLLTREFRLVNRLDVNYMVSFVKT